MRELNELGLVMAVAVDKAEGEEGFIVTVQIAKPKDASGGAQGSQGGSEPFWIGSANGKTIFDAIRNIAQFSSRRIMWAHNNIIIIGESLAEQGITPIIDFFTHNPELRMKTWVAVARGKASSYVSAKTGMETIPAISIAQLFRYSEIPAKSIKSDMVRLFRDFKSDTSQPILAQLSEKEQATGGQRQIVLAGSGIFKNDKLVGWLSPEETRGLAWIRKTIDNAIISVACDEKGSNLVAVELRRIKTDIKSYIDDGKLSITVYVSAIGDISEQDNPIDKNIDTFKADVKKLLQKKVSEEIRNSIEKVQKDFQSDVLDFGRIVHIQHKKEWYGGIKKNWTGIFPHIPIQVDVDINIRSSVLYQIPMKQEKVQEENKE